MISDIAKEITSALGVIFLHTAAEHVVTDRKALKSALSHSLLFRSRRIRVSMSQLLSVKVGEKYLLVANVRRPERVTPIGGVVRYFTSEIPRLEGKIGFTHELHGDARFDLRGYILGKHFVPFLRWYATGAGREQYALAREIDEEFNEIGIPDIRNYLRRPEFVKDRVIHEGPHSVEGRDYWQYRYFEICSLREESDVSNALLKFIRKSARTNPNLVTVSTAEIRQGRLKDGRIIGDSAGYLFSDSRHGIGAPPLF